MKLSVETKVAAVVAAGCIALTGSAIAQGRSKGRSGGVNHYASANNGGVNTQMSQQGDNRSVFGRSNAGESKPNFSDEKVVSSAREQREERHDAREQREERHEAREQRKDRHDAHKQREERLENHRQREQRYQNAKDRKPTLSTPFDGSLLDVKSGDVKQ